MRPIVITTQRTGSTLICELLFNIAAQRFKYKNNLDEYFTITTLYNTEYRKVNGIIRSTLIEKSTVDRSTATNENDNQKLSSLRITKRQDILSRLDLLKADPNYMIKLFSTDLLPEIEEFVSSHYDIVYLERKNKIEQFLSFSGLWQTNQAHYTDTSKQIDKIYYDPYNVDQFVNICKLYYEFKQRNPSKLPTLYYEDFIQAGGNESALIQLLDLPVTNYKPLKIKTIPTPYTGNIEDLIVNKQEWERDKPAILDRLRPYS